MNYEQNVRYCHTPDGIVLGGEKNDRTDPSLSGMNGIAPLVDYLLSTAPVHSIIYQIHHDVMAVACVKGPEPKIEMIYI